MPNGAMVWPNPPWHYHFAAVHNGLAYDEVYPKGLPLAEYKAKFEHQGAINFTQRPA